MSSFVTKDNLTVIRNKINSLYVRKDSQYEANLSWGGRSISGGISPVGASLSAEHSANRLAFLNPAALLFEYSDNAGSSWTTIEWSAEAKVNHVTKSNSLPIGNALTVTTSHRSRMTLTAQNGTTGYVYTRPKKLLINMSTNGHGVKVTLEYKTGASGAAWSTLGTYDLSGWSGWNEIDVSSLTTLGGGTSQTSNIWYWRLTYQVTSVNANYQTSKPYIICLRLFGDTCWTRTSEMGETGHLYAFDASQNATFPAAVTATSFSGSGASLTSLNASNISSGTLNAARLPTSGVTAGTYGQDVPITSLGSWEPIYIPYITVDDKGRITEIQNMSVELGSFTSANSYHTTGSWSGLTYTATAQGGAGELKFTIPTGTGSAQVALGNHTHSGYASSSHNHDSVYLKLSGGTCTGDITAPNFIASSDRRLKTNIKDYSPSNSILDLSVKEFDFKSTGTHTIGCIAQELQELFPELVCEKSDGYLGIHESKLVYLLLLECKKMRSCIDELSRKITE